MYVLLFCIGGFGFVICRQPPYTNLLLEVNPSIRHDYEVREKHFEADPEELPYRTDMPNIKNDKMGVKATGELNTSISLEHIKPTQTSDETLTDRERLKIYLNSNYNAEKYVSFLEDTKVNSKLSMERELTETNNLDNNTVNNPKSKSFLVEWNNSESNTDIPIRNESNLVNLRINNIPRKIQARKNFSINPTKTKVVPKTFFSQNSYLLDTARQSVENVSESNSPIQTNLSEDRYSNYGDETYAFSGTKEDDDSVDNLLPNISITINNAKEMELPSVQIAAERLISTTHDPRGESMDFTTLEVSQNVFNHNEEMTEFEEHRNGLTTTTPESNNVADVANLPPSKYTNSAIPQSNFKELLAIEEDEQDLEETSGKVTPQDSHLQHSTHNRNVVLHQPKPKFLPEYAPLTIPHEKEIPILDPDGSSRAVYAPEMYLDSITLRTISEATPVQNQPVLHHLEHSLQHYNPEDYLPKYPDIPHHFPPYSIPYPTYDSEPIDWLPVHFPQVINRQGLDEFGLFVNEKVDI